jgi:hypothetical protein
MTTPTSSKNWKKRTGGHELTLPSGNVCLVKRPGMQKLMAMGIMPDSLTPIAMKHIAAAESGGRPIKDDDKRIEQELLEAVISDPTQLNELMQTFDKVVAECVVSPKVHVHWWTEDDVRRGACSADMVGDEIEEEDRLSDEVDEDDVRYSADPPLYTDDVDDEDKQFIFQYVVGGSRDLERFRSEQASAVEDSPAVEDVPMPAKRASRARK